MLDLQVGAIITVVSRLIFAAKIVLVVVAANAIGVIVFLTGKCKTGAEVFQKQRQEA